MSRSNPMFKSPFYSNPNRYTANISSPSPPSPAQSSSKQKVVSIPINFVDSNHSAKRIDSSSAAIKIQKVFRGFLVRKNIKIVHKIEEEVNEIEMRFKRDVEMERIVADEKERLKIGEMCMRLLFRLDCVRGVRDYRKRVIRRVISIQEMLDSIANKNVGDEVEEIKGVIAEKVTEIDDVVENMEQDVMVKETKMLKSHVEPSLDREMMDSGECKNLDCEEAAGAGWEILETNENDDDDEKIIVENKNEKGRIENDDESKKINVENVNRNEKRKMVNDDESEKLRVENEKLRMDSATMENVMEKMVAENAKLKDLVVELCERSAQQCGLMSGIAKRVENLEKVVKKMKKKDKKGKEMNENLL